MRRVASVVGAALGIGLVLAASGARAAESLLPVTFGIVPSVPSAITYLALDKGYLRDAGIDAKIETIDTVSKAIPFLATNAFQVVEGGGLSIGYFNALVQGLPIAMALDAGSSPLYHDLLVRPDLKGAIRTVADLRGRTVAIVGPGSVGVYELGKVLETAEMSLKDVDVKYVPFTQMGAAFANKAIDAGLEVPPFGDLVVEKGLAVRWIDPDKLIRPTPMSIISYMFNTDWAEKNSAVAHRLFVALARAGREYCQAYHHGPNRAEVVDVLVKYKATSDRALTERMAWQARDPNGRFNLASLVDVQDWFFKAGLIEKEAPAGSLADASYAEEAAKELGPFVLINQGSTLAGCR
jgi:NitT/TauT family transport system substrate-binding protein